MFLMETRVHESETKGFKFIFSHYNMLVVSSIGRAGGLLLFWKKECDLTIQNFSRNHVDFVVKEDDGNSWRGTGIYGWPMQQEKYKTWALLRSLKTNQRRPWICFGDFNEALYAFEKAGRRGCNNAQMEAFLEDCKLWLHPTIRQFSLQNYTSSSFQSRFDASTWREQQQLREEIKELLTREELMWKQRSRIQWLSDGDKNTRFFHSRASNRRKRNSIFRLKDQDGRWIDNEEDVRGLVAHYFNDLFSTSSPQDCDSVVKDIDRSLTETDITSLEKQVTTTEVYEALMQMAPTKAPGPDGMPALFFQKFWVSVGPTIVNMVSSFFESGVLPPNINKTLITLIPKVSKPESLKDLRPISLCNVLYKIISKVLVNRIKPILPRIIQENQSAFVSDRVITDNAIVAFEVLHWLKNKKNGKKGSLALKVDMSKAYDRVEWPFIHSVLKKFGFPTHFTKLIMTCVSSVTFSFNINGQVSGHVAPTRGLRQGDPISPYLFIMCAEVLSSMIRKSVTQGYIHGVKVCRGAPTISHLFFADDSIFFSRATEEESCRLKSILDQYCRASGQVINYEKSEISFSANVEQHVRSRILESLSVREVAYQTKYLGLPSIIGRSKKVVFQSILDRIKRKLGGWKEKTLSIAGKEVLIKSVAQAMPMYVMNIFLLPDTLIDEIHRALNLFWWGDGVKQNPIRWCSWERMCVSKFRGGMGFRHLGLFNRSLLAKQVWRLITSPNTLAGKVLKARYFPRSSFLDAKAGYRPSYFWRSFIAVKELVRKGCKWNIGHGCSVNVWEDFWLADHRRLGPKPYNSEVIYVRDLLNNEGNDWNYEQLASLFPSNIANNIVCSFACQSRPDSLYWYNSPRGEFSCKSAYLLALETSQELVQNNSDEALKIFHAIWMEKVPNKVKIFLWQAWHNYIPYIDNLRARGLNLTITSCTHCGEPGEDVLHVLFRCSKAKQVWDRCIFGRFYETQGAVTIEDFCSIILDHSPTHWDDFMMILWGLWTRRNKHFHGQAERWEVAVEVMAKRLLLDYFNANKKEIARRESWQSGMGYVARIATERFTFQELDLILSMRTQLALKLKAKAIWWAIQHARSRCYPEVVFESDSLTLVHALRNQLIPLKIAAMFSNILSKSLAFGTCDWSFVKREGNMVAHSIARWALGCTTDMVLEGDVPSCASGLVSKDIVLSVH
ncbi:reverse transcriptase [Tanacetum coccineum]|uniref:Reverse transcriptase n=1 Tax=Tanacetum coccineum TaxID=301880 RepID=A0ABQ5DQC1_9ASTR